MAKNAPVESLLRSLVPVTDLPPEFISLLDRDIESGLKLFLQEKIQNAVFLPEDLACAMAYAYTIPSSKFYQQAATLKSVRSLFFSLQKSLEETKPDKSFEIIQKLEPLLCAYLSLKDGFPENDQKAFRAVLSAGLQYLESHPVLEFGHRGMACAAVMALGYRFSGEKVFLQSSKQLFTVIHPMFSAAGEILENGMPDYADSAHSLQSLLLYRIMSDDAGAEDVLHRGMDWYTRLFTNQGYPLLSFGSSFQKENCSYLAGLFGCMAFCSAKEPRYVLLMKNYYEAISREQAGFILPRGGHYFLRGAMALKTDLKEIALKKPEPVQVYVHPDMQYVLVNKNYQTAVVLRSPSPYKGLQAWAYSNEPPLLFPLADKANRVTGFGLDTHLMDVQKGIDGFEYNLTHLSEPVDTLIMRQGELVTGYVFCPDVMVLIYNHTSNQAIKTEFVLNSSIGSSLDVVSKESVSFKNSQAAIFPCRKEPIQEKLKQYSLLTFEVPRDLGWFAIGEKKAKTVIRPIVEDLFFVYVEEKGFIGNIVVNLSSKNFDQKINYPDTTIPIPAIPAYGACFAQTLEER